MKSAIFEKQRFLVYFHKKKEVSKTVPAIRIESLKYFLAYGIASSQILGKGLASLASLMHIIL